MTAAESAQTPARGALLSASATHTRRQTIGDLLARSRARSPRKLAIAHDGLRQSYEEFDDTVNRAANALRARGVRQSDRVVILSHNSHAFAVAYFALARVGAISVPVNFMLTAPDVAFILQHAGVSAVMVEDRLVAVMADAIELASAERQVRLRWVMGDGPGAAATSWVPFAALTAHTDGAPCEAAVADDDPIQLMYTSGTESRPKGATLTTRSLIAQYASCIVDGRMTSDDVEIHALPLYHCAQLHCFLSPGIALGASNVILSGPDPTAVLDAIEHERATKFFAPPTVWISLLRHPSVASRDLTSLRKGYYGASIMPVEVLRELGQALPQMSLFNFYGQTEMSPMATVLGPEDQVRKAGSAGRAAINVETRVVDDDDRPVPPGTVGEIVHRGPHVMAGYWNDPIKTAEAFRNGWFHSGDLGVMDDDGYLTVVDRKKDMIKTGGENVASREVEEVLYQHPAVSEAAVIGLPDPRWIEAVTAVIVLRDGHSVDERQMISFARDRLASFKVPKRIVFVRDLPKNASGKVLKRELRSQIAGASPAGTSPAGNT